jgi:hypothetical protein
MTTAPMYCRQSRSIDDPLEAKLRTERLVDHRQGFGRHLRLFYPEPLPDTLECPSSTISRRYEAL